MSMRSLEISGVALIPAWVPMRSQDQNPKELIAPEEDARLPILEARIEREWWQYRSGYVKSLQKSGQLQKQDRATALWCVQVLHDAENKSGPRAGVDTALHSPPSGTTLRRRRQAACGRYLQAGCALAILAGAATSTIRKGKGKLYAQESSRCHIETIVCRCPVLFCPQRFRFRQKGRWRLPFDGPYNSLSYGAGTKWRIRWREHR